MNIDDEIKNIIDNLESGDKEGRLNREKLLNIFRYTELNIDVDDLSYNNTLLDIKREIRNRSDEPGVSIPSRINKYKKYKKVMAPAFAMIVLLIIVFLNPGSENIKRIDDAVPLTIQGNVDVLRGAGKLRLKEDVKFHELDRIVTSGGSIADVSFGSRVTFRITENSLIKINRMRKLNNSLKLDILIVKGSILLNIKKLSSGDSIKIKTSMSEAEVRGTIFGVNVLNGQGVNYEVYEGKVRVRQRVPSDMKGLNPSIKDQLNRHFDNSAVVLGKSSMCSVKLNKADLMGLDKKNIAEGLKKIPAIIELKKGSAKFQMVNSLLRFIEKNDSVRLAGLKKSLSISREPGKIISSLPETEKKVTSYRRWKKGVKSGYIIHVPDMKLLITVSKNGKIESTDFKSVKWRAIIKGAVISSPVVDGQMLYVASDHQKLTAFNLLNGSVSWVREIEGNVGESSGLTSTDGYIYAGTTEGRLYKFLSNGTLLWSADLEGSIETRPLIGTHMVFVSITGGTLYGLDKRTGLKVIKQNIGSRIVSIRFNLGNLYIVTVKGKLLCYNYNRDEFLWEQSLKTDVSTELIFDLDSIYVFGSRGSIIKLTGSGKILWVKDLGNRIIRNSVTDKKYLYISSDTTFYVIDKDDGDVKWSVVDPSIVSMNIVVSKKYIYFISRKKGITSLKKQL